MFQFTTTTVINSNVDYTTNLPLWSTQDAEGDVPASINIKRHLKFLQPNVLGISYAPYTEAKVPTASLDLSGLDIDTTVDNLLRIALYIRLSDSANSYYANDLVFKGRPFYIEFVWKKGAAATDVALQVKKMVKKFMLAVYEKDLVKVDVDGSKVIIKGVDEYQRFTRVDIEQYVDKDTCPVFGEFVVIKSAFPPLPKGAEAEDYPEVDPNFSIEQGVEGFGTYQYVLKNLRLPTAARLSYGAVNADEAPILGAKYDEFIIHYCVNRGVMGGDAVGEATKSITTHVFYVNQAVSADFKEAIKSLGDIKEVPSNSSSTSGDSTSDDSKDTQD